MPPPADSNVTENTSLKPQDKITYTPGNKVFWVYEDQYFYLQEKLSLAWSFP
jgi:hypothetical protein